ncbi:uncharacterized protein LOC128258303 isoform X1 [Drosophila gunungcola]|uniref:uncharacterized protein LOC128258303 isoform X1 n=2 Tax=Drosophila gunungcola TaxID=103775 RepID=UPI0022E746CB|nr:uncharacterized protein LOC128258303 isoform X1 [Drosophila gunungcola]
MVKMVRVSATPPSHGLISESEMMERQKKYTIRLQDIAAACSIFRKSLALFRDQEEERSKQGRWEQFMRCDGLPKARSPIEIRTFLAKLRHFEDIEFKKSIDWTLEVDERSILTQNIYHKDQTRSTLEKQLADNPGSYFENNFNNCLDLLAQIDALMDNEVEMDRINTNVQIDILEVYTEVQREIENLFDRLTYRILGMQKVYMKSTNGMVATWSFSSDSWCMDLWGLLNVPIIFKQMEVPVMMAEFKASGVQVQMPLSVLYDCLTVRCVHTTFDHHSEDAKSFDPPVVDATLFPNAGITDMEESMVGEWLMQQDIQVETLDAMNRKREEYEELMQLIADRTQQAAKEAKSGKTADGGKRMKIVIPKTPKAVPIVPQGMYPEVYEEFLIREEAQFKNFVDNFFHPNHLNMRAGEVNLRECIIIGGIYNVTLLRRPDQKQFEKFNIILHEDGRVLKVITDVVAKPEGDFRSSGVTEFTRMTLSSTPMKLQENELPFFVVTVKLPPDLCRWGKPEVCHYLREMEIPPEPLERRTTVSPNLIDPQRISSELAQKEDSSGMRSTVGNMFSSTLKLILRHSIARETNPKRALPMNDFQLEKPLNAIETMNLKHVCLPRIISSFKFPSEFSAEQLMSDAQKSKSNRLIKRVETEMVAEVERPTPSFDYTLQECSERMYPVFEMVAPVEFTSADFTTTLDSADTSTAFGLVSALDTIKQKYLEKPLHLLNQIQVTPKKFEKKWEKIQEVRGSTYSVRSRTSAQEPRERKSLADRKSFRDVNMKKNVSDLMFQKTGSAHSMAVGGAQDHKITRRSGSVAKRRSTRKSGKLEENVVETHVQEAPILLNHWTKQYIIETSMDPTTNTLTFRTDRLGIFGFAFKRYEHFPFSDWCLQPSEENPDEIIFNLDTFHVRMIFYISSKGVRGYVTDLSKGYTAKPVKYVEIVEPISDFRELRKLLVERNLNIFAENDACYYITNGYFSIKHMATELHIYNTMAMQCKQMKFYRSSWNRLAQRRDIIMNMKIARDNSDYSEVTMRVTPEKTTFVKIFEMCSDDINVVKLRFEETWRNVNHYNDFSQAIYSMNPIPWRAVIKKQCFLSTLKGF